MKLTRKKLMELAGLKESLDPNSTYQIDITYDHMLKPDDIKQVSGDPLTIAKSIKKAAIQKMGSDMAAHLDFAYGGDEFVSAYELDKDTYYIITGEETMTIVGKPKSVKYGSFWTSPDQEWIEQMDEDSMNARKV